MNTDNKKIDPDVINAFKMLRTLAQRFLEDCAESLVRASHEEYVSSEYRLKQSAELYGLSKDIQLFVNRAEERLNEQENAHAK